MRIFKIWNGDYPGDVRVEKVATSLTEAGHEATLIARNRGRRRLHERLPEADLHRLRPWRFLGKRLDDATTFPAFFNPRWMSAIFRTARASSCDNLIEKVFPATTDIYFRYWYRTSRGTDPTCANRGGSGMKCFMPGARPL